MAIKQDPFEGQFTPSDIRSIGRGEDKQPEPEKAAATKAKKPMANPVAAAPKEPARQPNEIIINPQIKGLNEAFTRNSDTVVVLNGRMNPVTKGHEENVNGMHDLAKKHSADHLVVATHSHDEKTAGSGNKNPLSPEQKLKHLTRAFPNTNITTTSKEKPSIFHQLADLHSRGYKHVVLAAGEDRTEDYERIQKYNGQQLKHGFYNFDSIKVKSTGERKPGISGTDMRKHAEANNFNSFKSNLPQALRKNTPHAKDLFADVRNGMKMNQLKEHKTMTAILEKALKSGVRFSTLQEVYQRGVAAWERSDSGKTADQFAFDRINSFINLGAAARLDGDLAEVVDMQARLQRRVTMAMHRRKIERAREIAMKRFGRNKNLRARALKIARGSLRKRLGGSRGAQYASLSTAQKIAVDKLLDKRRAQVKNIANKIINRVKRDEASRLSGQRTSTAKSAIVASYEPKSLGAILDEATYQGKKVTLNKPSAGDVKKSKVFVDPDGDGKAKKVNFGDKNMTIKKNIPARRASFRARHNCDEPGPKDKARYWSCRAW